MKLRILIAFVIAAFSALTTSAQEIETIFGKGSTTGGYIAMTNKFSTLGEHYANISEVYGGVFLNRRWLIGLGVAGSTNNVHVPSIYSVSPNQPMTYQYGQGGMMIERVIQSNRAVHMVVNVFGGAGFTAQYNRYGWNPDTTGPSIYEENWFYVIEPGAQVEMNLFKWMRISPGISYRHTYGSSAAGLSDGDLSRWSYNITLKLGGFGRSRYRHIHRSDNYDDVEN